LLDIENLSKDNVYGVMRELLYSFNYAWFLMDDWIKKTYPEAGNNADFLGLLEEFGVYEAKRLSRVLDTSEGGIQKLIHFLNHSHWKVFEDIEAKRISERSFSMKTLECSTQKAAEKWGMGYYDCSEQGCRIREGFFREIDPGARVERIFTPPDERVDGSDERISCEWLITL
jgi:hypothetical protein